MVLIILRSLEYAMYFKARRICEIFSIAEDEIRISDVHRKFSLIVKSFFDVFLLLKYILLHFVKENI